MCSPPVRAPQVLLGLLILFNDPFAVTLYNRPSLTWSTVYAFFLDTFLAAVLLFWLTALDAADEARHDGVRRGCRCRSGRPRRGCSLISPPVLLLLLGCCAWWWCRRGSCGGA